MQQEELIGLFSRTLNFSNPTPPPEENLSKPQPQRDNAEEQPPIYASQHYVPNRHMLPVRFFTPPAEPPQPQPEPEPEPRYLSDERLIELLNRNSIDPSTLFPSQVNLIRNADSDQRLRLLELWRISPPNLGYYDLAKEQSTWLSTTLQQEEAMAKLRYERRESDRSFSALAVQEIERPASAPESGERSRGGSGGGGGNVVQAEPYMMSGYELLAQKEYEQSNSQPSQQPLQESSRYNQATDPVFRGSGTWEKGIVDMENRYGSFEEMRGHGQGQNVHNTAALNGLDEDMVM
ncbi:hypothetical protein EJ08DRAFT_645920 [Tothia fuscella]|uniref:Uncharacterized protein n=1 Tax=Tothia fuscella TaxID=1048955 RepID=A0A9P4U2L5_9PEZI|nr:hypothetical protein EJ08DRAFT_645920 [Tothia fuscella]